MTQDCGKNRHWLKDSRVVEPRPVFVVDGKPVRAHPLHAIRAPLARRTVRSAEGCMACPVPGIPSCPTRLSTPDVDGRITAKRRRPGGRTAGRVHRCATFASSRSDEGRRGRALPSMVRRGAATP